MKDVLKLTIWPLVAIFLTVCWAQPMTALQLWGDVMVQTVKTPVCLCNVAWLFVASALYHWFRGPAIGTGIYLFVAVCLASPVGRATIYYCGGGVSLI